MNSFNHHAYGAVADWLYAAAGGIRPASPGYETIRFTPLPDRRIREFYAQMQTPHGKAASGWSWKGNTVMYELCTPVSAEICIAGQTRTVTPGTYTFYQEDSL